MKVTYDRSVDILRITFSDTPIEQSDEVITSINVDYDADGNVVVVEVLDATKRGIHYEVLGLKNAS